MCMMAALLIGNRAFMRDSQYRKLRGEARGVRLALTLSLQALRKIYAANLGVLAGGKPALIAGRNQINLLRVQLARLTCLEPREIEAVWGASIAAETAETAMAINGKGGSNASVAVLERGDALDRIRAALTQACAMLETAANLLTPAEMSGRAPQPERATVIQFAAHALRRKDRRAPLEARPAKGSHYSHSLV
jgi:hypothetical protein